VYQQLLVEGEGRREEGLSGKKMSPDISRRVRHTGLEKRRLGRAHLGGDGGNVCQRVVASAGGRNGVGKVGKNVCAGGEKKNVQDLKDANLGKKTFSQPEPWWGRFKKRQGRRKKRFSRGGIP